MRSHAARYAKRDFCPFFGQCRESVQTEYVDGSRLNFATKPVLTERSKNMLRNIDIVCNFHKAARFAIPFANPGVGGTQLMAVNLAYLLATSSPSAQIRLFALGDDDIEVAFCPPNMEVYCTPTMESSTLCKSAVIATAYAYSKAPSCFKDVKTLAIWSHNLWDCLEASIRARPDAKLVVVSEIQRQIAIASDVKAGVYRIQNPIDLERYPFNRGPLPESREIAYLGNLTSAKGALHVARLWASQAKHLKGYTLHMLGGGDHYSGTPDTNSRNYEGKVRAVLSSAEPDTRVIYHGTVTFREAAKILSRCSYGLVNPTGRTECFPTSLVELLASGVVPLALPRWGNGELLRQLPIERTATLGAMRRRLRRIGVRGSEEIQQIRNKMRGYVEQQIIGPELVAKRWLEVLDPDARPAANGSLWRVRYALFRREPAAVARLLTHKTKSLLGLL